jgi:acetylornithine deacetylase/succinyl-diaminopimelate desuccinylase-like protein
MSDPSQNITPVELLQNLIRFNTTNPPGNEEECVTYIESLLKKAGIETKLLAQDPKRPNLIARLQGRGESPPLLLYGHLDVVTTENQRWRQPPFEGKLIDGYVWGRGAFDDKGGVAMILAAFLRAKAENLLPAGDVVLAILSDEESGGKYGAKFLVENHPSLFEGIRYAIGESGAFTTYVGSQRFYPIMLAEKQAAIINAIIHGRSGHALLPIRGEASAKLAELLKRLDKHRLPVHITSTMSQMLETSSKVSPFPTSLVFSLLQIPSITDAVLDLIGTSGKTLEPLLHNTVTVHTIRGGDPDKYVVPNEIIVELTASILPGFTSQNVIAELRGFVGEEVSLEVVWADDQLSFTEPNMGLFGTLSEILRETDPAGIPLPIVLPTPTDGHTFARLGIQTYGFMPMNLPASLDVSQISHGVDERVPVEALDFGADAIYKVLKRFSY